MHSNIGTELNLTPCIENKLVVYKLTYDKILRIRAGQFVGIRSHKNETLHLSRLKAKTTANTVRDRVSGVYRVMSSKEVADQKIYCESCYNQAMLNKEPDVYERDASILAGSEYHLTRSEAFLLELHLDKIKNITLGSRKSKILADNMNKEEAIERILKTFPLLTDESPSSRVEYMCVLPKKTQGDHVKDDEFSAIHNYRNQRRRHHHHFHYNPKSEKRCLRLNARLCWALTNESDLDTVHYFFIYSATEAAANAIASYHKKYLHNIDPNNTDNIEKYFNMLNASHRDGNTRLKQGKRDTNDRRDIQFLKCHAREADYRVRKDDFDRDVKWRRWYTLDLPFSKHHEEKEDDDDSDGDDDEKTFLELPPDHDHIIMYTTKNPRDRKKLYVACIYIYICLCEYHNHLYSVSQSLTHVVSSHTRCSNTDTSR